MKRHPQETPAPGDKPSRTRKKKAAQDSQKMGEALLALGHEQLLALHLPQQLQEAVLEIRNMKSRGARRRQLQYIGSIMRHVDARALRHELDHIRMQAQQEARSFKMAEQWRDELSSGDQGRLEWLVTRFPEIDSDLLRQLTASAGEGHPLTERRKAARALFRFLRPYAERLGN